MLDLEGSTGTNGDSGPFERALELAYRYLNRRDRTVDETRRHLEGKDVGAHAIEEVVETLVESGYLDDARFARLFAEDKRELEHWGSDRIRRGLVTRGVDRGLIEATLGKGSGTELDRALELLGRRFPTPPRDGRDRDRAFGVLLRKGYDSELAVEALRAHARRADES
jgi:regulatory protein